MPLSPPHALGSAGASPYLAPRSPRVGSAGAPLPHHAFGSAGGALPVTSSSSLVGRGPSPPSLPPWPAPSSSPSCAPPVLPDRAAPVLNLDRNGQPLTFRSALAGPHRAQWIVGDDDELVKLVETTRTLTPVHTYSSSPTYYNRVVKEKWTPSSLSSSQAHLALCGPTWIGGCVAQLAVTVSPPLVPLQLPLPLSLLPTSCSTPLSLTMPSSGLST
jgi:hypothetical protein